MLPVLRYLLHVFEYYLLRFLCTFQALEVVQEEEVNFTLRNSAYNTVNILNFVVAIFCRYCQVNIFNGINFLCIKK